MGRYEVSERRAVSAARFCLSSIRYQSARDPLTALRQRLRELAQTRVRFGYRRLLVLLRREGWDVGKKRVYRLYIEEGLALRRKRPWRHATAVHREQRRPATARNEIWSMDFVADQLADGRRFRALTVLDLFTRECVAIDLGQGLSGRDVVDHARAITLRTRIAPAHLLRQRHRVRQRRDGSVGVHERRHPRLQSARQTDGQCRDRIIQRTVP
jgi:putative transposase